MYLLVGTVSRHGVNKGWEILGIYNTIFEAAEERSQLMASGNTAFYVEAANILHVPSVEE